MTSAGGPWTNENVTVTYKNGDRLHRRQPAPGNTTVVWVDVATAQAPVFFPVVPGGGQLGSSTTFRVEPQPWATREKSGQILVLFAMGLVVFVGFAALVVDVGLNYAYERRFQAVADAASVAGAQELQPTTRTAPVTSTMQASARARALQAVVDEMVPGSTPACVPETGIGNSRGLPPAR